MRTCHRGSPNGFVRASGTMRLRSGMGIPVCGSGQLQSSRGPGRRQGESAGGRYKFWILDFGLEEGCERPAGNANIERRALPRFAVLCQLGLRQVAKLANARSAFNVEPKRIRRERWAVQAVS